MTTAQKPFRVQLIEELARDIEESMTDQTLIAVHGPNSHGLYVSAGDRAVHRLEKKFNVPIEQMAAHYIPGERLRVVPDTRVTEAEYKALDAIGDERSKGALNLGKHTNKALTERTDGWKAV